MTEPAQHADYVRTTPCPKCGWGVISLRYCTWQHRPDGQGITAPYGDEHLDAICDRCRFVRQGPTLHSDGDVSA